MLTKIRGSNKFCGPAAMSAIFNITSDDAAHYLRTQTGRKGIKGLHAHEIVATLVANGCVLHVDDTTKPLFREFAEDCPQGKFILEISNHYVAFSKLLYGKTMVTDRTWVKRRLLSAEDFPFPSRRVRSSIQIIGGVLQPVSRAKPLPIPPTFMELLEQRGTERLKNWFSVAFEEAGAEDPSLTARKFFLDQYEGDWTPQDDRNTAKTISFLARMHKLD